MASTDPAFLFYPGDYLRDTQCLSENVQVSYDRVMCEHMRNICISQTQLNFFTKKLSADEKTELLSVLTQTEGGFQISWVAESISKRKAYSESRRQNRGSKKKEDILKTSSTYVPHMENEIENENVNEIVKEKEAKKKKPIEHNLTMPFDSESFKSIWTHWKAYKKTEHKFNFASVQSEQASLTELTNLSNGDEQTAIAIIQQSMAKGWKGLFELKTDNNGQRTYHNKQTGANVDTGTLLQGLSQFND